MTTEDAVGMKPMKLGTFGGLHRITFVEITLWALRIGVVVVVVGGTIGTLIKGTYSASHWFDFLMFGLTIGGIYATVVGLGDRVRVAVADGSQLEISKQAVGRVIPAEEASDVEELDEGAATDADATKLAPDEGPSEGEGDFSVRA